MEIVKTIFPHGNSTHDEEKPLPECLEWVRGAPSSLTVILLPLEMDPLYFSFLMLSCGFCLVVIVLAGLQLYYVIKYVSNERIRTDLYYLVLMFPVRFESQMEKGVNIFRLPPYVASPVCSSSGRPSSSMPSL